MANQEMPWWLLPVIGIVILLVLIGMILSAVKWYYCFQNPDQCDVMIGMPGYGRKGAPGGNLVLDFSSDNK